MKTKAYDGIQKAMGPEVSDPTTSAGSGSPEGLSPLRESPETSGPAGRDRGGQLQISEVRLRFPPDQSGTVVAYASCLINGSLVLNDIRIERGRLGGLVVVYPSRPSSTGKRHSTFNPVTREAGEAIRQALLGQLAGLLEATSRSGADKDDQR